MVSQTLRRNLWEQNDFKFLLTLLEASNLIHEKNVAQLAHISRRLGEMRPVKPTKPSLDQRTPICYGLDCAPKIYC